MNQKQIWDKIAPEWHEFKINPAEQTIKFLKKQTGKVLDLGSGSGRNLTKIKAGKMYLIDFSDKMINLAKKKAKTKKIQAEFHVSDMTKLPFEDNFFNSAICICALHCIESKKDRKKVVQELFRVLKPKSQAKISVWDFNSKRFNQKKGKEKSIGWKDKGKRYYYLYDEKEVHDLFKKNRFKIINSDNSKSMINFIVEKP